MNDAEILKSIHQAIDDKFGVDTVILDIKDISQISDYFIITSGNNENQIKAICNSASEVLFKNGYTLNHMEGYQSADWILLDFNHIIVHVFNKEDREFYNLERLWNDAKVVDINSL